MNYSTAKTNGIASRPIYKRRSPPRSVRRFSPQNASMEINHAYVDSQILQRPQTVKQTTPADMSAEAAYYDAYEFEIDAYASNEDLIRRFVSTNA